MRLAYFPPAWKESIVIFLPKPGKSLYTTDGYRPISLLPTMGKITENVIHTRIEAFTREQNILPGSQHRFRSKHGTCHQLLRVTEFLADNLNKGFTTAMVLLDVRQAFDRVWHDGLIFKLKEIGLPPYLTRIVRSYLTGRTFQTKIGDSLSTNRPVTSGVPQRGVLSPLLYNLFCYDIPHNDNIITAQYADDIIVLRATSQISNCTNLLNKHLQRLLDWYNYWKLYINENKTEAIYFSKRQRNPPLIKVNQRYIKWSKSVKYLGVTFDRKLSWNKHIRNTQNKANAAHIALKPFFNNCKISNKVKLRAFSAIIRSICTYAIPIWGTNQEGLDRLRGTFMRLLRNALGIPWFVRNSQILKESKITSPAQAAKIFAQNLRESISNHSNPTISSLANYHPKSIDWVKRPCSLIDC